jgi:hypothetical protein
MIENKKIDVDISPYCPNRFNLKIF